MARASIAVERDNGDIEHIYVNAEGQMLGELGQMLLRFHNSYDGACELIALGDLSYVRPKRNPDSARRHNFDERQPDVTVAYARDRGDTDTKAMRSINVEQWIAAREEGECKHFYVWRGSDRVGAQWFTGVADTADLQPLREAVANEIALREQTERDVEHQARLAAEQDDSQVD
jgi:hypothetical protein